MWWGGHPEEEGEGAQGPRVVEPELSSEGSGSPPIDLMAEEDDDEATRTIGADDQDGDDDDSGDDFGELHEQFAAQEKLLGELRGVLKSNSEKLENKEKVVKEYADRLSSHSRYYGSSSLARSSSTPIVIPRYEESPEGQGSVSRTSKLKLFKKELDEARIRESEELKQQQSLELLVKQLQMELAERDRMISSMREDGFSVTSLSFAGSPLNSPYVMSPDRRSPTELSPNRSPPLGCSLDSAASYGGFSLRSLGDSRYLELSERNIELERRILDLEENLREKDELIRARTQAVTLMSADLSAKGKSTLDQLEETRSEMKKMQSNFAEQEAEWRSQMSMLKTELVAKDKKLQALDDSYSRLEKTRFELSTKNAELQEKVVLLQTDVSDRKVRERQLTNDKSKNEEEASKKILLLERRLELAESSRDVRRDQFLEEIRGAVTDSELGDQLVNLENQVAELEEEKGNLQLKLVEYEELIAQEAKVKGEFADLNEKFCQQEDFIDQYVRTIERLEGEKSDLYRKIAQLEEDNANLSNQLSDAHSSNEELSSANVRLEMKAVVLEEERDRSLEEISSLETTISNLKNELKDQNQLYNELKEEHSCMVIEYHKLESSHSRCQSSQKLFDKDFVEKSSRIKELTISVQQLEKVLECKNDEIGESLSTLDQKSVECAKALEKIEILEKEVESKDARIVTLSSLLDESSMAAQLNNLEQQISDLQQMLKSTEESKFARDRDVIELQESLQRSREESAALHQQFQSGKEALEAAQGLLRELEVKVEEIDNERSHLKDQLISLEEIKQQLNQEKSHLVEEMGLLVVQVSDLQTSSEEISASKLLLENQMEQAEAQHAEEKENLEKRYSDLSNEHTNMVTEFHKIEHLHSRCQVTQRQLEADIQEKDEKLKDFERLIQELRDKVADLETAITDKDAQLFDIRQNLEKKTDEMLVKSEAEENHFKSELEESRTAANALNEQLAAYTFEMERLSAENISLADQIKSLEVQMKDENITEPAADPWSEDLTGFGSEDVIALQQVADRGSSIEQTASELESTRLEVESLTSTLRKLEQENEDQAKLVASLRIQISELEIQIGQNIVKEDNDGWNEDFDGFGKENEQAENVRELATVKAELDSTRSELDSLLSKLSQSEKENDDHVQTIASLKNQISCLENKIQDLKSGGAGDGWNEDFDLFGSETVPANDDKSTENVDRSELESVRSELASTLQELESLRSKLNDAENENESHTQLISSLRSKIASHEAMPIKDDTEKEGDGWNDDFEGFGPDPVDLEDKVDKSELDQIKVELETTQSELNRVRSELEQVCDENQGNLSLVAKLNLQIATLESQVAAPVVQDSDGWNEDFDAFGSGDDNGAAISELQSRLDDNLQLLQEKEQLIASLEKTVSDLEVKRTQLETQLADQEADHSQTISSLYNQLEETRMGQSVELEQVGNLLQIKENELLQVKEDNGKTIEQLNSQVESLIRELESKKKDLAAEKETLVKKEDRLQKVEASYTALVSQQDVDVQALIVDRDRQKAKNDLLTDKCKKLLVKCKQMEAKAKENELKMSNTESELATLTQKLNSANEEIFNTSESLKSIQAECDSLREKAVALEKIESQLEASSHSLAEAQSLLATLEQELLSSKNTCNDLTSQLNQKNTELNYLTSQMDLLSGEQSSNDNRLAELQAEKENLGKEIEALEAAALDLKLKLDAAMSEKSGMENSFHQVTLEKDEIFKESQEIRMKLDQLLEENENLTAMMKAKDESMNAMRQEIETRDETISVKSADIVALTKEIETKTNQLSSLEMDLEAKASEIGELAQEVETKTIEMNSLAQDVANKSSEVFIVLQDKNELEHKLAQLAADLNESHKSTHDLRAQIDQMELQMDRLKQEKEAAQNDSFAKENIIQSINQNTDLEDQLTIIRHQLKDKETEAENLKSELKTVGLLEDQLAEMNKILQERSDNLEAARARIDDLEGQLADRTHQLEQARLAERPLDLAEFNRPPPDVTQYQGVPLHPDVAHHPAASFQPDIMPQYTFQGDGGVQLQDDLYPDWNQAGGAWDADDWALGAAEQFQEEQQIQLVQQVQEVQQQVHVQHVEVQQGQDHRAMAVAQAPEVDINTLKDQLNSQNEEIVSLRQLVGERSEACQRMETDLSQLISDSDHLRQSLSAKEQECSDLKSNLSQLRADIDLTSETYKSSMQDLRGQHSREIEKLQASAKALEEDHEALQAELEIKEQECNELKSNLANAKERIQKLEQSSQDEPEPESGIEIATSRTVEVTPSIDDYQSPPPVTFFKWDDTSFSGQDPFQFQGFEQPQFYQPQQPIQSFNEPQVFQAESEPSYFQTYPRDDHIQDLERQVVELRQSLENANLTRQSLEQEIANLPNQLEALKEEKERQIRVLEDELLTLRASLETAEQARRILAQEISQLPEWTEVTTLKEEKEQLNQLIQTNLERIESLQARVTELESSLEVYSADRQRLEEEKNQLTHQISSLQNQEQFAMKPEAEDNQAIRDKLLELEAINQELRRQIEEQKIETLEPVKSEPVESLEPVDREEIELAEEATFSNVSAYFSQTDTVALQGSDTSQFIPSGTFGSSTGPEISESMIGQEPTEDPNLVWFQSELARYQQAIADWQAWADGQNTENLQSTLNQYIEAYNTVSAELVQLQSAQKPDEDNQKDEEISKLKSSLRAKKMEIDDLLETVDRLKSEKEDLEQEMTELSSRNESLARQNSAVFEDRKDEYNGQDYFSLYEEIKFNYEESLELKDKLVREVSATKEELISQTQLLSEEKQQREIAEEKLRNVEAEIQELDKRCNELTIERTRFLDRIETLEEGNEKFFEMKEKQDSEIEMLKTFESDWKRRYESVQWQLTEMEQKLESQKSNTLKPEREQELLNKVAKLQEELTNIMGQNLVLKNNQDAFYKENAALKMEELGMKHSVNEMEQNCSFLNDQLREAGATCVNLKQAKEKLETEFAEVSDKLESANASLEVLQNVVVERDQLFARCLDLETQVNSLEKEISELRIRLETSQDVTTPARDYARFQTMNHNLQVEIESLRGYIDDQQQTITSLQQYHAPQASQELVEQLQRDVYEKNDQLAQLQAELEMFKKSREDDREAEIRQIFDPDQPDLSLENERLKNDLNQSVRENRQLSQQMESWKQQLSNFSDSSQDGGRALMEDSVDFEESPVVIRMRQEQAYRSVAALQLRVEELTLEVTKLLEERDTLQLKLSNVMRQFERQKESASRASTARSTPVPWMAFVDSAAEVRDLRHKIEELGKLNYALDIQLQKERENRQLMQSRLSGSPRRILEPQRSDNSSHDQTSPGGVIHL